MPSARRPLGRIAVVGVGQVGLLAACALRRTCPSTEVRVVPDPIRAHGFADLGHSSLPSLSRLHQRIGLDEAGMVARASASHRLATRLERWDGSGGRMTIGFGAIEGSAPGLPGCRSLGAGIDAEPFSLSETLAEAGRFLSPSHDAGSLASGIDYALRFDPAAHRAWLASLARHLGVVFASSDTDAVDADLIVDTADAGDPAWIDWTPFTVVDGIVVGDRPASLSPLDRIVAEADAITLISPGRDLTRAWRLITGGGTPIRSGRVAEAWTGNRVRIGAAAATLPPTGWTNLHLATIAIELLPGRDIDPGERAEYNRRCALGADCVLDFVVAHLAIADRDDTPLWRGIGAAPRPPDLAHRLEEHRRRRRLPYHEEDSIPREPWIQLLSRRSGAGRIDDMSAIETYPDRFAQTGGDAS